MQLATKTLKAIEDNIYNDQGASYRQFLGQVIPAMDDAYRGGEFPFRSHMGASLIGGDCARAIWYGFHWTTKPMFGGRLLRLFNRGHLEEARFIAMLLAIGCTIYQQDAQGNQFRISDAGGHFGGSGDGVGINIPDLEPGTPALLEFKTSASKPFAIIKSKGCREAKFEHYVQMQVYMKKMGLPVALYMVVNKDNDELYAEIIDFNNEIAEKYIDRGVKLVFMETAPKKMNESAGFYKCKWCDHHPICHLGDLPEKNCRTCENSKPQPDGTWNCIKFDKVLDKQAQFDGCEVWVKNKEI